MVEFMSVVIILILLLISINSVIIYYLHNLEGEICNCVLNWRHNYLKYSFFILGIALIPILFIYKSKNVQHYILQLCMFIILLIIVNGFIFSDYIKYLENSKCNCAIDKQKKLHTFLYYYSYLYKYISIVLAVVAFLLFGLANN